jgi:hypothetical protein
MGEHNSDSFGHRPNCAGYLPTESAWSLNLYYFPGRFAPLGASGQLDLTLIPNAMEAIMKILKGTLQRSELLVIVSLILALSSVSAQAQQEESVTVSGKGHGSLVSAVENRKITAALVVLRANGTASITLISDLQLHAEAEWCASKYSAEEIELKITGGELSGNASGSGKLVLSDDRKAIKELSIKAKSFDGRELTLTFIADNSDSIRAERINLVSWPSLY